MHSHFAQVFDISTGLGDGMPVYPGDTRFCRSVLRSSEKGDGHELSSLTMSSHSGTHVDLPAHFIAGGDRIDDYPAARFIVPALVVEVDDPRMIPPETIAACGAQPGQALLFKTRNSTKRILAAPELPKDYIYLTEAGARACVEVQAALVGIDSLSIDGYHDSDFPAHMELLGHGIPILEGIDLSEVPAGCYTLVALPLRIEGGEASPVRAVLLG